MKSKQPENLILTKNYSFYGDKNSPTHEEDRIKYFNQILSSLENLGFDNYVIERTAHHMTHTPCWTVSIYK